MAVPAELRTVVSRWDGGMRAVVQAGDFQIVVDEPPSAGGTDTGPQPTDFLLVSVASCFTLAMAYVAAKRGLTLSGLQVQALGTYEGLEFARIEVVVTTDGPIDVVDQLIPHAERVCYVTNTLRRGPQVQIRSQAAAHSAP